MSLHLCVFPRERIACNRIAPNMEEQNILTINTEHMGVSENSGIPKWMVKIMENPIKMDDLGVPQFKETPTYSLTHVNK